MVLVVDSSGGCSDGDDKKCMVVVGGYTSYDD